MTCAFYFSLRTFHRLGAPVLLAAFFIARIASAIDTAPTPLQLDFFEKKIRPILVDNCYKCHSHDSEKVKGGLLLDTRAGLLKGGDTGPGLVPGNVEKSLLIEAVRYTNKDLQMPPGDKQLESSQIADLENWIKMGAPDPRSGTNDSASNYAVDLNRLRQHWSFRPVVKPAVPQPTDPEAWVKTPIDAFILSALQAKALTPSPRADKVTLLRRATFDLIGLPPTPQELDDFLTDNSPDAFARVVDRLLASPHYGERWGRHWLDVAHFSDTKGNIGNGRDERYPYAYIYRDYVIRSFNEDLPYDQFIIQQIAADKLPLGQDKRPLAALGFLTLGNRAVAPNDIIDDRIDIVSKGTMALTVACARCHDHKFDPIFTKDYYALHGIFNSSVEPKEEPLIEKPKETTAYHKFVAEYGAREAAVQKFRDGINQDLKNEMIGKAGTYMLASWDFHHKTNDLSRNAFLEKRGLIPQVGASWDDFLKGVDKRPNNPIFGPWFAFAKLSESDFATQSKNLSAAFFANKEKKNPLNPAVAHLFVTPPASLAQLANRYTALFVDVNHRWEEMTQVYEAKKRLGTENVLEPKSLPDAGLEQVRQFMTANYSPMLITDQRFTSFINRDNKLRNKLNDLDKAAMDVVVNSPGSPARAPVLEDAEKAHDSYVMIKGNPGNHGPIVPRHFLTILSPSAPPAYKEGSGRLELAGNIASKDNPLTARVMVNRIWLNHFGEGIVRTPDDFGTRGEPPTHPELLDYLAAKFMEDGWSVKRIHRLIMLSSVYQQSSDENPRFDQIDPENRYLWHMNRRRLDFEGLRDTILAIGGDLDLTMGGHPVKLDAEPYPLRRTVYGIVDRRNLPNMYAAFDFASPDLTTGKRENTVVPQQALFMMNNSLVVEQARNVVRRVDFKAQADRAARVQMLYKLIYQRSPTEIELKLALDYLNSDYATEWQTTPQAAWEYGFSRYDAGLKHARQFSTFINFSNGSWQAAAKNTDPQVRGMYLNAEGGYPGKPYAVVRRWTSPRDGYINISGNITHSGKGGDGVQAALNSSRAGQLGAWTVVTNQVVTQFDHLYVKRGETLDFITDSREDAKNDAFKWPVIIKMEPVGVAPGLVMEWNSQNNFSGEPRNRRLNNWEKFAQVLLETNELTFIN